MRILAVDDDDIALEALKHTLCEAGHELPSARNGRDAPRALGAEGAFLTVHDGLHEPELAEV